MKRGSRAPIRSTCPQKSRVARRAIPIATARREQRNAKCPLPAVIDLWPGMGCDPFFRHHYGNGPVAQVKPCAQSCNREIRAISAFDMTALIAEHSFQVRPRRGSRALTATLAGAALYYKTDFAPLRPASVLRATICAASMEARQPVVRRTFGRQWTSAGAFVRQGPTASTAISRSFPKR